ncbi:MAG: hypothetical protein ACOY5F_04790 [Pseudomonadota bacterium]
MNDDVLIDPLDPIDATEVQYAVWLTDLDPKQARELCLRSRYESAVSELKETAIPPRRTRQFNDRMSRLQTFVFRYEIAMEEKRLRAAGERGPNGKAKRRIADRHGITESKLKKMLQRF